MGLSIDVLVAGLTVIEVPCDITHRVTGNDRAGMLHRAAQYKDVLRAIAARKVRRRRIPVKALDEELIGSQPPCHAYRAWPGPKAQGSDLQAGEPDGVAPARPEA